MRRPLCLLCLAFAAVLILATWLVPMPVPDYEGLDGQRITAIGRVYRKEYQERAGLEEVPVIYLKSVHILEGFVDESKDSQHSKGSLSEQIPINEIKNIVCYLEKNGGTEPKLGTVVRIEGEVGCFGRAGNPGEFDMQQYYSVMKLSFRLEDAHIKASGGEIWYVREGLYKLKQYFSRVLNDVFPAKEASVMKAMLLGEKNGLDAETKMLYQQSAIIHILSISGLHISMIGMGLYKGLRRAGIPQKIAAAVSAAVIICYGMMTGMSVSSVRAILMFLLHLMADVLGRTYDMATALALAAVFLLAGQPRYAEHSGFLFSFGAVAAIGGFVPVLIEEKHPPKKKEEKGVMNWHLEMIVWRIKRAAASCIAVTLGTLPVHFWFYYQFPFYSILLNLAVIPLMTVVMGAGLCCMIIGGAVPEMAKGTALAVRAVLWFYEQCCMAGEKIPGGLFVNGRPEAWQIFLYLLLLVLLAVYRYCRLEKMSFFWKSQWILAALCILLLKTENGFQVTMLDVGQGDCIHIRSSEGKDYLIDGGSSSEKEVLEYQILPYLKFKGVKHLEAVFVTHADSDHCSGIVSLLEEYPIKGMSIGSLILPDIGQESTDEQYEEMEMLAAKKGIRVRHMSRGQQIRDGDMSLLCVHPYAGYETREKNEYSLVLLLSHGNFTGLFTGDVEGAGENTAWEYIKEIGKAGRLTMLKVAHHGSGNSTGREMLETLVPRLAFISCGKNNPYGHPHEELLERLESVGSRIYATPEHGAVTVKQKNGKIWVYSFW